MPIASLTCEEAAGRAALLTVDRVDVDVDLTGLLEGDAVRCTATIAFRTARPGEGTFVDVVAEVERAALNGAELDPASARDGRLPLPALSGEDVLVVTSVQRRTAAGEGILRTVDPTDGLVYVWTTFEPDDARRLWACFDQPDLKAVHRFTVVAPASWTVLHNTAPEAVEPAGPGARRWRFAPTPPLPAYVTVVNAGPFHELRRTAGGYDLGLYCRRSLAPVLERDADELFELTAAGLAWFGERFASPFPQRRYDQAFVPDLGGAMENWGSVTHTDAFLHRSEPSDRQRAARADVLLHEMAHMWFGDLVTMRWWDDLWLNEAFASWASTWAMAGATRFTDAWAIDLLESKLLGYRQDMSPATHAIRGDVPDVRHALASFDDITYDKGQAVLRQLAAAVGEDAFVAGLRAYFAEHAWGNTVLDDLVSAVAAAAGRDLSAWTAAWLDRAGTDRLTLDGGVLRAVAPDGDAPRPHRLRVAGYSATLEPVGVAEVAVAGPETAVDVPGAFHQVNAGDLTFASVRADRASLTALLRGAGALPEPVDRVLAVTTAWDAVVQGELDAAAVVEGIVDLVAVEPSPALVESLLLLALQAAEAWAPPERIPGLARRIAVAAEGLAGSPAHRRAALRALAATATEASQLALLDAAGAGDVHLAWRVLARRAELGDLDDGAVEALLARDPDPDAAASAIAVRASLPDPAAKAAAWEAIMVERRVPAGTARRFAADRFWRPLQRDVLAPYADRYLAAVDSFGGAGILGQLGLVRAMFPYAVVDDPFLARVGAAAEAPGTAPTARTALLVGLDTGLRMVRARTA